jgi:lysophospholipase L1-like esterase
MVRAKARWPISKVAVLMFGTNNTGHRLEEPALTVAGIARDIEELKKRLPRTRILLLAVFPREEKADGALRKINDEINRMLARLADGKQVYFLNINHAFLQPDGTLSKDIMPDLLHPNARGYQLWADAMQPELERLMRP